MISSNKVALIKDGVLKPVIKILTDYPRDDLASDEVGQALTTACVFEGLDCFAFDVGAVLAMDTVMAAFKTAQLAMNSKLGYGHVFLTNCAPRKNIISSKSKGEGVVIGVLENGVTILTVNSGYALAPFASLIEEGKVHFFESQIPNEGSQFRSRDFFPEAAVKLGIFLRDKLSELGEDAIVSMLAENNLHKMLQNFELVGSEIDKATIAKLPTGAIWYIDNFGNIKLNISHDDIVDIYGVGCSLSVAIGDCIADAMLGGAGFSQGEGILAITCGSSGWAGNRFAEIFLRGGSAANILSDASSGEQCYIVAKEDLKNAQRILRDASVQYIANHNLFMMSEARLIQMFAHYGLIKNGYDTTNLRTMIDKGRLVDFLNDR